MTKQISSDGGQLRHRFVSGPYGLTRVGPARSLRRSEPACGTFLDFLLPELSSIDATAVGEGRA